MKKNSLWKVFMVCALLAMVVISNTSSVPDKDRDKDVPIFCSIEANYKM